MATHLLPATSGNSSLTSADKSKLPRGVLLVLAEEDKKYVTCLGSMFNSVPVKAYYKCPETLTELIILMKKAGLNACVTTRLDILQKLLPEGPVRKKATVNNYAGSLIEFGGIEFLIISPLKRHRTVPHEAFVCATYISKITAPYRWREESNFEWKLVTNREEFEVALQALKATDLIAVDTETSREHAFMRMAGFCGINLDTNTSMTYVVAVKHPEHLDWIAQLCALPIAKVMQNGKYDLAYFARWGCPVTGYMYDTKNMLHAWYSELPKSLGFNVGLLVRNSAYWKDLSETGSEQDGYHYNALDCWGTLEACLAWLTAAPKWAKQNYVAEFSLTPALHLCEMQGIRRDTALIEKFAKESESKQAVLLEELRTMIDTPNFNPSSPKQTVQLMQILGATEKERESSDEKHIAALSYKHPLNEIVLGHILEYRGERKETSTYLPYGDDSKEFGPAHNRRTLYSINADGTDTGRCASREHHFWCGLQVQNVGADSNTKETFVADPGWNLWEADFSQAEDRGVAVKSGDAALLKIFSSNVDSHSYKASMFFGIAYESIYDANYVNEDGTLGKTIQKDIRQLGKRINHGSNYNMGARVLVDTMGAKALRKAQVLLQLPRSWSLEGIAQHLLNAYERAFPMVKRDYYRSIVAEVKTTSMLTGDTGWVRYCFGDPTANKPTLNSYIAHVTQSLNAMLLNKAFIKVFNALWRNPNFKLFAQIHDSILFATREGHDYLAEEVRNLMAIPWPVTDCKGITRTLLVPVDVKKLGKNWRGSGD